MNLLLIFGEDWGRHNSGCQRITLELLKQGHPITWVNTIGTRRPRLDRYTIRRGLGKIKQWSLHRKDKSTSLKPMVLSPLMWPSLHFDIERRANSYLLAAQLRKYIASLPVPPIIISKVPLPSALVNRLPAKHWVYYCVDHVSAWPGSDRQALAVMEASFIDRADRIIVASHELQQRMREQGRESAVLTHGVDLDLWRQPGTDFALPTYERPLIVFWGLVDRRIDMRVMRSLSQSLEHGTILLVGPQQAPPSGLFNTPRVVHHPAVDYFDLSAVGQAADVLIMPYCRDEVTRYMQPVKLTEYMSTGKPVVVTSMPATQSWRDGVFVAEDESEFAAQVQQALESGLPNSHRIARKRLESETWTDKAAEFLRLVRD